MVGLSSTIKVQLPIADFLILVEAGLELSPSVNINSLVCIRLEYFDFSVELNHHGNMVVLAVSYKSLDGTLSISGRHEQDIACLSTLQELTLKERIFFSIDIFFALQ